MPLIDFHNPPSPSMQRWFGVTLGLALLLIASLLGSWLYLLSIGLVLVAAAVTSTYYLAPRTQLAIIRTWQVLTFPLAFFVGHACLLLTYYCLFLPIGMILRWRGYDPLELSRRDRKSNWQRHAEVEADDQYFRQF